MLLLASAKWLRGLVNETLTASYTGTYSPELGPDRIALPPGVLWPGGIAAECLSAPDAGLPFSELASRSRYFPSARSDFAGPD